MKPKIFLITLLVVANTISAKMEQRNFFGYQNRNVTEHKFESDREVSVVDGFIGGCVGGIEIVLCSGV
jgi:hypothetical protein